ncbi:unnamed protein product [Owenia fusiformis]|uniref:Uncharacterized protein n=1 Tax=Owenia fusiformis TaxID=6347 RepID=A0A8S4PXA0_OWEFU|nr:unnamed protein product [Owenia fusiformis]
MSDNGTEIVDDTAESELDLTECVNNNEDIVQSLDSAKQIDDSKTQQPVNELEHKTIQPELKSPSKIKACIPFVIGCLLFIGLAYGGCCIMGFDDAKDEMDLEKRVEFAFKICVVQLVPVMAALVVSLFSTAEKHALFFREGLDSGMILSINLLFAVTHLEPNCFDVMGVIVCLVTAFRTLQWVLYARCYHYRCIFGFPPLMVNLVLFLSNIYNIADCGTHIPNYLGFTGFTTEVPPAADLDNSGWF